MSEEKRCETCKHFEAFDPSYVTTKWLGYGGCQAVPDKPAPDAMAVQVAEGDMFYVRPDFGCVLHESR